MTKCFHGVLPKCHLNARANLVGVALSELILPTEKMKSILSASVAGTLGLRLPEHNFLRFIFILETTFNYWVINVLALCLAQLVDEEEVDSSEHVSKTVQVRCLV